MSRIRRSGVRSIIARTVPSITADAAFAAVAAFAASVVSATARALVMVVMRRRRMSLVTDAASSPLTARVLVDTATVAPVEVLVAVPTVLVILVLSASGRVRAVTAAPSPRGGPSSSCPF